MRAECKRVDKRCPYSLNSPQTVRRVWTNATEGHQTCIPPMPTTEKQAQRSRCSRSSAHIRKIARSANELLPLRTDAKKNQVLLRRVRDFARTHQRAETPQVFLSVREAATRFDVSASAIAEVYRQLAREGLLTSVRGSRTILRAFSSRRSHKVQGVVGIPVSMRRFLALRDYRDCFQNLEKELFAAGFGTRWFFFEDGEVESASFISRFAHAAVDSVIWVSPDASAREALWRLRDRGIKYVGINFAAAVKVFCRYEIRRREAIRAILREWRQQVGIHSVSIVRTRDGTASEAERLNRLDHLAAAEQIGCEIATLSKTNPDESLTSLCSRKNHGIVIPSPAASLTGVACAGSREQRLSFFSGGTHRRTDRFTGAAEWG